LSEPSRNRFPQPGSWGALALQITGWRIARHLIDLRHPGRSLAERTAVARIKKKSKP